MDIVTKVREYVETECKKPSSHYGYEPFIFHFGPVVIYATQLADKFGADVEIVQLAGWLHDIGAIEMGRKDHHINGARIAGKVLERFDYPKDRIELVQKCILNHRGSVNNHKESMEEKIVAEADVLSNFDNISGIFKAAFIYENLDQGAAQKAALKKLENKYNQLSFEDSKKLIKPKYEAAKLLLGSNNIE
jgi:uncharacterized protein